MNASGVYRQLLVAVDFGDMAEPLVRRGLDLGERLGAVVDVANVLERIPAYLRYRLSQDELRETEADGTRWSEGRMAELRERHREVHGTHAVRGSLADGLRGMVSQIGADLLVLGAHERRGMAVLLGDRSDEILHKAPCDVLLMKTQPPAEGPLWPYQRILAAVDLTAEADLVVACAAALADGYQAELIVLHVIDHFPVDRSNAVIAPEDQDPLAYEQHEAERHLRELTAQAGAGGSRVKVLVSDSTASRAIPEFAKADGADLIVAGSHGRHGLGRLLGSTADGVRHRARCDVMVVRAPVPA